MQVLHTFVYAKQIVKEDKFVWKWNMQIYERRVEEEYGIMKKREKRKHG